MDFKATLQRMREKAPATAYGDEDVEELLGYPGAMLSGGKISPEGEEVYWNACVFNDAGTQLWHGDINLTRKHDALNELAGRIGTVHVTPEQPFRFEGLKSGDQDRVRTFEGSDRA